MAITPVYGLRYQQLGDAPDGAGLGENLATDVEAELERIDGAKFDAAKVQRGTILFGGSGTIVATITFPTPFATVPYVVGTVSGFSSGAGSYRLRQIDLVTTTDARVVVVPVDTADAPAIVDVPLTWIAVA